jgi:hypothetical protein
MSGALLSTLMMCSRGNPASGNITSGTTTYGGNGTLSGGTYSGPAAWFSPSAAGIGSSYWLRITRTGGTPSVNFSQAQGAFTNITASGLLIAAGGAAGSCTGNWEISPSSTGAPVVASGTISVNNTI